MEKNDDLRLLLLTVVNLIRKYWVWTIIVLAIVHGAGLFYLKYIQKDSYHTSVLTKSTFLTNEEINYHIDGLQYFVESGATAQLENLLKLTQEESKTLVELYAEEADNGYVEIGFSVLQKEKSSRIIQQLQWYFENTESLLTNFQNEHNKLTATINSLTTKLEYLDQHAGKDETAYYTDVLVELEEAKVGRDQLIKIQFVNNTAFTRNKKSQHYSWSLIIINSVLALLIVSLKMAFDKTMEIVKQ